MNKEKNAAEVKSCNLPANTVTTMNPKTTKVVYIGQRRTPYEVKDNEVYDENTSHLLREDKGQMVEMKLCAHCQQWHPLSDFYKNKNGKDGLTSSCKFCIKASPSDRNNRDLCHAEFDTVGSSTIQTSKGVQAMLDWLSSHDKEMSDEIQSQAEIIKEQDEQISVLKSTIKMQEGIIARHKKNIEEKEHMENAPLREDDIMSFLNKEMVQPRMLFSALKGKDKTHIFYYKDLTTGSFHPVAAE